VATSASYVRRLDGKVLSFERTGPGRFRDRETGSVFDLEGRGVSGPHRGRRLPPLGGLQAEWYGWFAHHPDTTLFGESR
jgi:hypothetical protein